MSTEQEKNYVMTSRFNAVGADFMSKLQTHARSLSVEKNLTRQTGVEILSVIPLSKLAFRISRAGSAVCDFELKVGWNLVVRCPPQTRHESHKDITYRVDCSQDRCRMLTESAEVPSEKVLEEAFKSLMNFEAIDYV